MPPARYPKAPWTLTYCRTSASKTPTVPCALKVSAPGFVLDNLCFSTPGYDHIDFVGPNAGFGNPSNAIVAGFFTDSFEIDPLEPKVAVEFVALSILGGDTVDITVFDESDVELGRLLAAAAPVAGHRWGVLTIAGDAIGRINIMDPGNGAEGIMQSSYYVPEPTALLLALPVLGVVLCRRRWRPLKENPRGATPGHRVRW